MPPLALGLLVLAGAMHAGWNLLVKEAREKEIFTWLSLLVGAICFAPTLALGGVVPARAWPFVVASAAVEALYFFALTRAYRIGDFSLVYPIARGAAPALLALWAALFLGERPRPAGLLGLAILIAGLLVVGGGAWWARRGARGLAPSGVAAALAVALCISVYSAIDGAAVRIVSPLPYTVLILGLSAVFCAPIIAVRFGRAPVVAEWRANWPRVVAVGVLNLATYMIVLVAYSRAPVAYAGAVREVSVVFAALVGWRWLREPFGRPRTIGAALIFAGIVTIAVWG
jgi:drug/metabolite transporter (DMT)-like permease